MAGTGETPTTGLAKLLQDERFLVPTHQRDFSWSVDEVALLIDDVEAAYDRKDEQYFVGLMVFMGSEGPEKIVLDGQQRLATAVIYFSAVRNWLGKYSEYRKDADKIDTWFIGRSELGQIDAEPRIILNSANHQTFLNYVVKAVDINDLKMLLSKLKRFDRNRKLIEAAIYCHERIEDFAKENPPDLVKNRLINVILYFRESVGVVRLDVKNEDTAFTIFETLNDRGVELSPLDLVKNFLFRTAASTKSSQRLRDMEDRWIDMMSTLSTVKADAFLKAFWTSRHGRIQATNLFAQFKEQYKAPDDALNVSIDMLSVAEQYAALETAEHSVWAPYSETARQHVRSLKLLGARQMHPILLAAIAKFDSAEMERLLKLLEAITVRYQLIGGGRTGKLEIECARLAQAIYVGKIVDGAGERPVVTARAVFQECKEIYPSDAAFGDEFRTARETNGQKAVYIIRALERELRRREQQGRAAENEPGALTLEHILPKNPGAEWAAEIEEDPSFREDCVHRYGNFCLQVGGDNRRVGRLSFEDKKKLYLKSQSNLTNSIPVHYKVWDRDSVDSRQAHMANLAVSVWRFQ